MTHFLQKYLIKIHLQEVLLTETAYSLIALTLLFMGRNSHPKGIHFHWCFSGPN